MEQSSPTSARAHMVQHHLRARGVRDPRVLDAMAQVPREQFVARELAEFAYEDSPLPLDAGQTISQPYIVALMAEAAEIGPQDRVLEIGAGSGYGAAVLGLLARRVWTIERHEVLVAEARRRLGELGYDNVEVLSGDGTLGLASAAPFDAIVVTAGGPSVPRALFDQLAEGGRLVMPVGPEERGQELIRVRKVAGSAVQEDLGPVRFVPLVGKEGWSAPAGETGVVATAAVLRPARAGDGDLAGQVRSSAEPFGSLDELDLGPLMERIGDCSLVLLGESTHGTSEFYRIRDRITRALIRHRGFSVVAVEADWPDAASVDRAIRQRAPSAAAGEPFRRFPTWMWRNREVLELVRWLRQHNEVLDAERRVGFCGLDLYSMYSSRAEVIAYLDRVDPDAADLARHRYGCLTPWQHDPAGYGRAVVSGRFAGCEEGVVATLSELLRRRLADAGEGDDYLDAAQNAVVVANAERYYRVMYSGSTASWNLRDQHMFETLQTIRAARGPGTKIVVWEHNSHVGDARATEMGARGEHNVGMLCRREYGSDAYLVGFGTHDGVVAAASDWDGPMRHIPIRPSRSDSYERVCHDTGLGAFTLHLHDPRRPDLTEALAAPRLERAIGVIYRPETELASHYFQASLPSQFDEYVWVDRTSPVHALPERRGGSATGWAPPGW